MSSRILEKHQVSGQDVKAKIQLLSAGCPLSAKNRNQQAQICLFGAGKDGNSICDTLSLMLCNPIVSEGTLFRQQHSFWFGHVLL